jgi:hypothetical protein
MALYGKFSKFLMQPEYLITSEASDSGKKRFKYSDIDKRSAKTCAETAADGGLYFL